MNLLKRSYQPELLDQDDIPFEDIRKNMRELNFINTWLGGHAITIEGVKGLLPQQQAITICEIGCGGGDNLLAISRWCESQQIAANFIGIDKKASCIEFAQTRTQLQANTTWFVSDYRQVQFDQKPDIIFSSLFCHHFTDEELESQLLWMRDNSVHGFFINDLERNAVAYQLIRSLTKTFSSSYLVKHDAPLSVARSFKKAEWLQLLHKTQMVDCSVKWKWAFRYLVTCKNV